MRLFYLEPVAPQTNGGDRGILPEIDFRVKSLEYDSPNPSVEDLEARHGQRAWFFPPEVVIEHYQNHNDQIAPRDCGLCQEMLLDHEPHRARMQERMQAAFEGNV